MIDPVPFQYKPDGGDKFVEGLRYSTDILGAFDQSEQRIAQRGVPGGDIEFTAATVRPELATEILGLLWAHHADQWLVPLWPYAVRTTEVLGGGELEIPVAPPSPGRGLEVIPWRIDPGQDNPWVLLYASPSQWAVLRFDDVASDYGWGEEWGESWGLSDTSAAAITVIDAVPGGGTGWGFSWGDDWGFSDPSDAAWPVGTLVVPMRRARLDPDLASSLESLEAAQGRPRWAIEDEADSWAGDPAVALGPLYLGAEILTIAPNRQGPTPQGQKLDPIVHDPVTRPPTVQTPNTQPSAGRSVEFLTMDLGRVADLRTFLAARKGRQKPFWLPSWQKDLVIAAAAGAGVGTLVIRECGYATRIWPAGAARRHVLLRSPAGVIVPRRVSLAVSNGDGTETLTLIGPAGETTHGVAIDTTWLAMLMRFMRLDDDNVAFEWDGPVARLEIPVRELTAEVVA